MIRLILATITLLSIPTPATADCGAERSAVKLGLDAEARAVSLQPTDTTIALLTSLPRPRDTHRRAPAELHTYRIHATLTAYKLETDGDYHIVATDAAGRTMIVEIPSAGCALESVWAAQIAAARATMDGMHPGRKLRRTSVAMTVTGVGFFDFLHGQVGVAPNGIELHPVLGIEIGGGR